MANSKITITFNTALTSLNLNYISFDLALASKNITFKTITETWSSFRSNRFLIPDFEINDVLGNPNINGYKLDSFKFKKYFNLDYNSFNQFNVNVVGNVVEISCVDSNYIFKNFTTNSDATAIISNVVLIDSFEITSESVSESIDNCNYVDFNFTTNINIKKYYLNEVETTIDSDSLTVSYLRGENFKIELIDENNRSIFYPGQTTHNPFISSFESFNIRRQTVKYDKLESINAIVNVNKTLTGSSVQAKVVSVENLILLYSLDDNTYQTSNIYDGQAEGDYTLYIKDQFNCKIQLKYTVDSLGSREPVVVISKVNPINFVKIEDIDNISKFNNSDNSFNKDGFNDFNFCNNTLFNLYDKTKIQLKTNYKNIVSKIRFENGTEEQFYFELKTNNLSRYEKMDCIYYKHSSGKLGIYFNTGNTYNNLNVVIGDYELNGNLPEFGKIGNVISIDGLGVFNIYNTVIDSSINKKVILIDEIYEGELTLSKIECIYDLINFEIYEYEFDFSSFEVGLCDVYIEANNSDEDKVVFLSENLDIQEDNKNSLVIISNNSIKNNRDVFYKFGIKFLCRFIHSSVSGYVKDSSEININDNSINSISSTVNFGDEFEFEDLTKKQMEQLTLVLSSEFIFINGISYLKDGELSIENEKNTNIYSIKAKMIKTNKPYSINDSGLSGTDEVFEILNVPTIITDGINIIKS